MEKYRPWWERIGGEEPSCCCCCCWSLQERNLVRGNGKGIDEERVREKGGKLIRVKGRKWRTRLEARGKKKCCRRSPSDRPLFKTTWKNDSSETIFRENNVSWNDVTAYLFFSYVRHGGRASFHSIWDDKNWESKRLMIFFSKNTRFLHFLEKLFKRRINEIEIEF